MFNSNSNICYNLDRITFTKLPLYQRKNIDTECIKYDIELEDVVKEVMYQENEKKKKDMFYKKMSFRKVLDSIKGTKLWQLYHCKRNNRPIYYIIYDYPRIKNNNEEFYCEFHPYFFKPDRLNRYSIQYYGGDFNECLHVLSDTFQ